MCDFTREKWNGAAESKAKQEYEEAMRRFQETVPASTKPTPKKRIRPRNRMKAYGTYEVVDESEHHYICRRDFELRAYAKVDWEEVPNRVVWRDVTKEVSDNHGGVFFHEGRMIRRHDPDFEITIKRRVEVEG